MESSGEARWWVLPLVAVAAVVLVGVSWFVFGGGARGFRGGGDEALVVYCAHDAVYSEAILKEFERQTGIPVEVRFDTEATKSLGLIELILRERQRPRCDVFWNNEQLGTMRLAEEGMLEPYRGPGYERIPAAYKDPEGRWTGFAGRMRVWILNVEKMEPTPEAVNQQLAQASLSDVAIAKPLYGTTRTHYTVLWNRWGPQRVNGWHEEWRRRGVTEATGNAQVKNLVASGAAALGLTDSDDFFVAVDEGRAVQMLPYRLDDGSTICIPNTVAIIAGTDQPDAARRLVDYLLSAETELALAKSKSRQIPLGEVAAASVPEDVRQLRQWAEKPVDLSTLGDAARACLAWLKSEYVQ